MGALKTCCGGVLEAGIGTRFRGQGPPQGTGGRLRFRRRHGILRAMNPAMDIDPKELRPLLHAELDRLRDSDLAAAHRALLEIEMQRLLAEMDEATDRAWESGQITEGKITEAILEHRREHPYR